MENAGTIVVIFVAIVVVGVFAYMARRLDQRRHQDQLERIQERIRRSEENSSPAAGGAEAGTGTGDDPESGAVDR